MVLYGCLAVLCVALVRATVPEHAVLVSGNGAGCKADFAAEWLAAAQEEAVRNYHTLNGGWLESTCCGMPRGGHEQRVKPVPVDQHQVLCLDYETWFPVEPQCASKKCDFRSHPELFKDDCAEDVPIPCTFTCPLINDPNFNYFNITECRRATQLEGICDAAGVCLLAYGGCPCTGQTPGSACQCPLPTEACACAGVWDGNGQVYGAACSSPAGCAASAECPRTSEACRKIESWLEIAKWLLVDALEYTEACDWDRATSSACAAETVYRAVNEWIEQTYPGDPGLQFIDANARATQHYRHVNSPLRSVTFDDVTFTAKVRVVQSIRTCDGTCDGEAAPVTSLLVYSSTDVGAAALPTSQLVWALSGVLADFATVLPFAPLNECGLQQISSNLAVFDPARRVPNLNAQDWATVRCDGESRTTLDLRIDAVCPVVLLFASLGMAVVGDTQHSLAQVQLRTGFAALTPLDAALLLERALAFRVATGTGSECRDYALLLAENVYDDQCTVVAPVLAGDDAVPLTLAPGTSVCVGGTADGEECSAKNECGVGFTCRRTPFNRAKALCYDGVTWHEDKPCAFTDTDASCPYGTCVGAINGLDGGRFPMLHFHKEADCATDASSPVCQHEAVAEWHKYPNLALYKSQQK
jgi:hypothetical protein